MEIKEIFKRYGIELNENQIWQFEEYYKFLVEENEKYRYIAEFAYRDVNYQLKGIMGKDEFNNIIKNLGFL